MGNVIPFEKKACDCGWKYPLKLSYEIPEEALKKGADPARGTMEFTCPGCGDEKVVTFGTTKFIDKHTKIEVPMFCKNCGCTANDKTIGGECPRPQAGLETAHVWDTICEPVH